MTQKIQYNFDFDNMPGIPTHCLILRTHRVIVKLSTDINWTYSVSHQIIGKNAFG